MQPLEAAVSSVAEAATTTDDIFCHFWLEKRIQKSIIIIDREKGACKRHRVRDWNGSCE
jgi:hypothetical protein